MNSNGGVAIVTGGATGIGREIALELARDGVAVAICDVDEVGLESTCGELEQLGCQALFRPCDVSSAGDVKSLVEDVVREYGHVDILVNNAGITRDGILPKLNSRMWNRVMEVNLKGAFLCSQAVLPSMKSRRRGSIVSLASRSYLGNYGQANYAASKGGIVGFTRALALEAGPYGVRVNALAPGYIDSPMTQGTIGDRVEAIKAASAIRQIGNPEDVAGLVRFLCSPQARYITGQTINICGGRSVGQLVF